MCVCAFYIIYIYIIDMIQKYVFLYVHIAREREREKNRSGEASRCGASSDSAQLEPKRGTLFLPRLLVGRPKAQAQDVCTMRQRLKSS